MGLEVEETKISIDELMEAYKSGQLREVFGTGTAAVISMIKELRYKDYTMLFDTTQSTVAVEVKARLTAIRDGKAADTHGWMYKI